MSDPYKILGIDRNATDDEVKKAYRNLARKYHPDRNPGNKAAEDMFKVVNEAYDHIMNERKNGGNSGYGGFDPFGGNAGYDSDNSDAHYQAAKNYIASGHYEEGMNVLMGISNRDARWYALCAVAQDGMGNNYAALECARMAVNLEPGNLSYRQLLNQLENGGAAYTYRQNPYGGYAQGNGCGCMDLCLINLICNPCCHPCF
ncbi:MAG: DnaJ domain-containing protein [Clostridia bacterium]|nr:DnaJ domain-containing protein [Clostridia bacterium]